MRERHKVLLVVLVLLILFFAPVWIIKHRSDRADALAQRCRASGALPLRAEEYGGRFRVYCLTRGSILWEEQ